MKINITKKNVIVATVCFLAGVIITTSGFLIFRGCTQKQHKRTVPPSFSQSQTYSQKENSDINNRNDSKSNSNKNKIGSNKKAKDKISTPESGGSATDTSNNS